MLTFTTKFVLLGLRPMVHSAVNSSSSSSRNGEDRPPQNTRNPGSTFLQQGCRAKIIAVCHWTLFGPLRGGVGAQWVGDDAWSRVEWGGWERLVLECSGVVDMVGWKGYLVGMYSCHWALLRYWSFPMCWCARVN